MVVVFFESKKGIKIEIDFKVNIVVLSIFEGIDDEVVIKDVLVKFEMKWVGLGGDYRFNVIEFEKDDDINFYMDVIVGFFNMCVCNYDIGEVDKFKVKFIVGRIILVIVMMMVMVMGLVCFELYKVFKGAKIEAYRNTFVNFVFLLFVMVEFIVVK